MKVSRDKRTGALNFTNTREDYEKIVFSKKLQELENKIKELENKVNKLIGDKQNG